jgi:hypothetical protein
MPQTASLTFFSRLPQVKEWVEKGEKCNEVEASWTGGLPVSPVIVPCPKIDGRNRIMPDTEICPECRVPKHITSEHVWLENGVIGSKRDETHRLVFFESGILDPIFDGIAEITGKPVEHLVVNAARLSTREYVARMLPGDVRSLVNNDELDVQMVIDSAFMMWQIMGYGKVNTTEVRYKQDENDFITALLERPYSAPLCLGNFAGSIEAWVEARPSIDYKKVSPNAYEVTITYDLDPPETKKRLGWKEYKKKYKPGDIQLERCATCGGPKGLFEFQWDLDPGVIRSTSSGRRMVMIGPSMIDPILDELEAELGETIPQVVIEAERRFVRTGFVPVEDLVNEDILRSRIALRGFGNLREVKMGKKGVRLHIENATQHLIGVGMAQGLFELAFNVESYVDWEFSEDGDLELEVYPKNIKKAVGG